MKQRMLELTAVASVIAAVALALAPVAGQGQGPATTAKTGAAKAGTALKTSWGEPDLQGLWSDKYAGKESFTDAELAALDKDRATKPSFGEKRAEKGTEKDVAGAYDSSVFLTRRHTGKRTALITDPPDGRIPPFTAAVQKRNAELRVYFLALLEATETCKEKARGCEGGKYTGKASPVRDQPLPYYPAGAGFPVAAGGGYVNRSDGPEVRGLSERCLGAVLPDFGGATGNVRQFVQTPGFVSIFYDTGQGQGWHRSIPVDGSPHLPADVQLWWGDSRGHWEGNTLVVDVTNFSPRTEFRGSRENLHLAERWTRTGPNSLEYVVTMSDPTTWTRPWTVKQEYTKQGDQFNRVYKEPRCHEGNFGMIGLLAGMRDIERVFAEGRGPDPASVNTITPTNSANTDEELDDLQ